MAIPSISKMHIPFLLFLKEENKAIHMKNVVDKLGEKFNVSDDELKITNPTSGDKKFSNRVNWARHDLFLAEWIESPQKGYVHITDNGLKILAASLPEKTGKEFFRQSPAYREYEERQRLKKETQEHDDSPEEEKTPDDRIDDALEEIEARLKQELREQILKLEDNGKQFEKFVLKFLKAMNYGVEQKHLGQTGDHGVDGVVEQDRLGLDPVYIQAKQQQINDTVGESVVRNFIGALDGKKS